MPFSFHYPSLNQQLASIYQQAILMRGLAEADWQAAVARVEEARDEYNRLDKYIEAVVGLLKVADRKLWLRVIHHKDEHGQPLPAEHEPSNGEPAQAPAIREADIPF